MDTNQETRREARLARQRAARAAAPKTTTVRIPVAEVRDGDWVLVIHSDQRVRGVNFGDGRRVDMAYPKHGRRGTVMMLRFTTGITYGPIRLTHDVTVRREEGK